jgi:xanthine dehydrogenase/oxidase
MVSRYERAADKVSHFAVNACLAPVCTVDFCAVTTIEGIGKASNLHPLQERLARLHGSQCGFCTPGIVMAMYAFLRTHPHPTEAQLEHALDGNLCRCTGYRPILDAVKSFACGKGSACCRVAKKAGEGEDAATTAAAATTDPTSSFKMPYSEDQEPIFPPFLRLNHPTSLRVEGSHARWFRPDSMADLLALKSEHPAGKLVVGNSEVGIETRFKGMRYPVLIAPTAVDELARLAVAPADGGRAVLSIGAGVTLSRLQAELTAMAPGLPEHQRSLPEAILTQLRWFAGTQIRNTACVGGNVCTASPISDLNPVFLAAGSTMVARSAQDGERRIPASAFFTGYRKTALRPDEILVRVEVPLTREGEYILAFKQARRREDDISIVCAAIRGRFDLAAGRIVEAGFGFGGMAPTTVSAPKFAAWVAAEPRAWNAEALSQGVELLKEDLPLADNAPGGQIAYRRSLSLSFFYKFYLETQARVRGAAPGPAAPLDDLLMDGRDLLSALSEAGIPSTHASAVAPFYRPVSRGTQDHGDPADPRPKPSASAPEAPAGPTVGAPVAHVAAELQVTGAAQYLDDLPMPSSTLHAAPVLATKAHAMIARVDATVALGMPGVEAVITHKDVHGSGNLYGAIFKDEYVFCEDRTVHHNGLIAIVVAATEPQAREAAKAVVVEYGEDLGAVLSIEDAIARGSFFKWLDGMDQHTIESGDVDGVFGRAGELGLTVLEGEVRMGGQEHFYLETQGAVVVPGENGELVVHSSTQNPTELQYDCAHATGVPVNRVVCKAKRIGGGFGGKETRSGQCAAAAAVAAAKLGRPVKFVLERQVDMALSGGRHPFLGRYRVAFEAKSGRVHALDTKLYSNGGCSFDLSGPVMDRALFHSDNGYTFPNQRAQGRICKTNLPSNTAFRGFGAPQGMFICEAAMDQVAARCGLPAHEVRAMHLSREDTPTHYGQVLERCQMRRVWDEVLAKARYAERRARVEAFNSLHRFKKRGIAVLPTKYGMSFTALFMNKAQALVHVYMDGTVLVSHGGVEMGQGLHTKMIQVAARALGARVEDVHIAETATDKCSNTSPTAASVSSDLNGMAVLDACEQINARLAALRAENPGADLATLATKAFFSRIPLTAAGFYATPDIGFTFGKQGGRPFNYYVYAACVAEVELDTLTGDHQIRSTDIVMDLGRSLNPALDVGQIEGAFVQGYGLFCLEEHTYMPSGYLFTRGPGTYKIPSFNDVPLEFNVSLLKGSENPRAIHSSKGVGEPPLFLGSTVLFALKDAVRSARADEDKARAAAGLPELSKAFTLHSPATSERLRMACPDSITAAINAPDEIKPFV